LIGPESEVNGEIYSAANDREQAAIVFRAVKRFITAEPELQARLKVLDAIKRIVVLGDGRARDSFFQALSAEAGTKHGLNPSLILYDELAQSKSRELYDTLATSQGARAQPLMIVTSTQNDDPQHILSELIDSADEDPTRVVALHAAPEGCDLLDEAGWLAANPALGDFRSLDELKSMAAEAVRLPSFESQFRLLYLNQRVPLHASLIARADWQACGPAIATPATWSQADTFQFEPGEPIYLGLDMSVTTDLTALVAISADDPSRAKAFFWKPADSIDDHGKRDRVRYDLFHKQGWLYTTPGRDIDPAFVAHKIRDLHVTNPVIGLAYDRYKTKELLRCLDDLDVPSQEGEGPGLRIVPWGQGYASMGVAVSAFERAVLNNKLQHDGSPLLTWNVMNTMTDANPAGDRKIDKSKVRFRIDGAVALTMALGLKSQDRATAAPVNPWEDPNFSLFGT
jgi:phage terminase large subunit-like protein